jgi:hypothetical protein
MAYNPGQELSSLNFSSIIGGSLNAVVDAQAQSAKTTVDFIQNVGFKKNEDGSVGEPYYVSFKYPKEVAPAENGKPAQIQVMEISVPILTIVPIPYIKVANAEIDLNVKINSISTNENSSDLKTDAKMEASASYKSPLGRVAASVKINASVSHQKKSSSSEKVEKEYSLHINVKAVQDDMPAGMDRILTILEEGIRSKPIGEVKDEPKSETDGKKEQAA